MLKAFPLSHTVVSLVFLIHSVRIRRVIFIKHSRDKKTQQFNYGHFS